ncbi:hypothetical protein Tco_0173835 [Tanacetum coccineum]
MADGLSAGMLMEHRDAQGLSFFTSRAWRRLFDIRGPLGDLRDYWIEISSAGDFLSTSPSYTVWSTPVIDMAKLVAAAGAPKAASAVNEGGQADLAPVQVPQQPPPPPPPADAKTIPYRMAKLEEDIREIRRALTKKGETPREYQRHRVRQRTGKASTSTSQQDQQQPDL